MELREWKYMTQAGSTSGSTAQASASSGGYKKRFEKLLKYHLDHVTAAQLLHFKKLTRKAVTDYGFRLGEVYDVSSGTLDRTIVVTVDSSGTFWLSVEADGNEVFKKDYKSYEELVDTLACYYLELPRPGTQEYNDLLTESLNEWQLMNPSASSSQPASNTQSQVPRYSKLIKQIRADGNMTYKINKFNDTILDITLDTAKAKDLNIRIVYDLADDDYELITNGKTSLSGCDYEKDILPLLQAGAVISNTDLCESAFSIADDFKLYDFLWENI